MNRLGLHVDEAMRTLPVHLVDFCAAGQRVCYIVTGAGTHTATGSSSGSSGGGGGGGGSGGARGRLRAAVRGWLEENDFAFQETGIDGGGGTFVVDLGT